ncbi:DUF4224 domain-containing protein [Nitrosovibrio sp. Nv4]|uniref:DUF4224 domain-containing protein n=1 Tax=Nitrosovibrio sp. Nv4 TaxID=1945880 RepID=UPI000BE38AE8|nr:DUF4224 domain-containing protein [Nitrosovibrio sp. Nv4]
MFLTRAELEELIDYKLPHWQCTWLEKNGYCFQVGRRKSNLNLPPRMYQKHGAYYYVTQSNKWIRLSDNLAQAKAKWIELEGEVPQTDTVAALIGLYFQSCTKESPSHLSGQSHRGKAADCRIRENAPR